MNIFFTADTHFNHKNIIKYSKRPFQTIEEMNEKLIENWNNKVKDNDEIYHLGDFGFKKIDDSIEIVKKLNGKKYLIIGNHDRSLNKEFKSYFEFVKKFYVLNYQSNDIVLYHYFHSPWYKDNENSILLHGHSHGKMVHPIGLKTLDVGVDCNNYNPFSFDEICKILNK